MQIQRVHTHTSRNCWWWDDLSTLQPGEQSNVGLKPLLAIIGPMADVTQILSQIDQGDPHAADQLLPLVYDELRKLAAAKLAYEKPGQSLQATALVHEAYLRILGPVNEQSQQWNSRGHFFGAAAEAMRRILVERARRAKRLKRGGDAHRVGLDVVTLKIDGPDTDILALNDALNELSQQKPEIVELVKLRYFAGLTISEAAQILEISTSTAERHWTYARAWLYRQLVPEEEL